MTDRLTIAAARPGMRVVCVDSAGARGLGLWEGRTDAENAWRRAPFTASLDAALSLVPEGWGWQLRRGHSGGGRTVCYLWDGTGTWSPTVVAATPALALCAAALRALASGAPR